MITITPARVILSAFVFVLQGAVTTFARPIDRLSLNILARDLPHPIATVKKRFSPIPDNTTAPRTVAKYIIIVVLIFGFLLGSLYMLRKCRPTFPRQSRTAVPAAIYPIHRRHILPTFGVLVPTHGQRAKHARLASVLSNGSTVVSFPSQENNTHLPHPPSAYSPAARVNFPAVGMFGSEMRG